MAGGGLILGGVLLLLVLSRSGGGIGGILGISSVARSYLGRPYHLGAGLDEPAHKDYPDPPYIDCGLLTQKIISRFYGASVPRTVTEQVKAAPYTKEVYGKTREELKDYLSEGVFIAFDWKYQGGGTSDRYSHTGMVSDQGTVIHASASKPDDEVVEVPLEKFNSGWRTLYAWKPIG